MSLHTSFAFEKRAAKSLNSQLIFFSGQCTRHKMLFDVITIVNIMFEHFKVHLSADCVFQTFHVHTQHTIKI